MNCRVIKSNNAVVTYKYNAGKHNGIDLVKKGAKYNELDTIVAHSDGTVVGIVKDCNRNTSKTGERIYGNYVKIRHDNGMYTLYAHMAYGTVKVNNGDRVARGQELGYMGNTGYSFGGHLHFEVRNENNKIIDPTSYVDGDLPAPKQPEPAKELKYNIGDVVTINGVYTNSMSTNKLNPARTSGKITLKNSAYRNPYLLDNGNLGWVNEDCITGYYQEPQLAPTSEIVEGDRVKVKAGVKDYNGTPLASFVFNNVYDVIETSGDRVVIGKGQSVTAAMHRANLIKV